MPRRSEHDLHAADDGHVAAAGVDRFDRAVQRHPRSAELHRQRAYTAEELTAWLTEAGFGDIRVYGDGKLRRPKEDEQRIYFSCVRK